MLCAAAMDQLSIQHYTRAVCVERGRGGGRENTHHHTSLCNVLASYLEIARVPVTVARVSLSVMKAPLNLTICSRVLATPPPSSSESLGYWYRMS